MQTPDWYDGKWIQTYTGVRFYPTIPAEADVNIIDIAHALSQQCRYGGHSKVFYSVAEHCVHVSGALPEPLRLWGLLHDASEAYLVDVPRPLKQFLKGYAAIEEQLMSVIARKYGLAPQMPDEVKLVDQRILMDEKKELLKPLEWSTDLEPLGVKIECWHPVQAKNVFLNAFYMLTDPLFDVGARVA